MPTRVVPPRDKKAPHSTWHYYQPGFDQPIQAQSYDSLLKAIQDFRVLNDLELGNPELDVKAYYRNRFPSFQRSTKRENRQPAKRADQRTLIDKVRTWSKLAKNHPWKQIDQQTAEQRAAICAACPSNRQAAQSSPCAPCVAALNRSATIMTAAKTTSAKVGVCTSVFHDNRVAVFMPKEELTRSLQLVNDTPQPCWLRKL